MAISMRLNTRRRTAVATATRLPRYARNDKVGMHEGLNSIDHCSGDYCVGTYEELKHSLTVRIGRKLNRRNAVY